MDELEMLIYDKYKHLVKKDSNGRKYVDEDTIDNIDVKQAFRKLKHPSMIRKNNVEGDYNEEK